MANEEHLSILKQGVKAWNEWRKSNPEIMPNLVAGRLKSEDLINANLSRTDLTNATLCYANLKSADLTYAVLTKTDVRGANFLHATLSHASLDQADFDRAVVGWTTFGNTDLSLAKNLDTVYHAGPSTIGVDTISNPKATFRRTSCGAQAFLINSLRTCVHYALTRSSSTLAS